MPRRIPAGWQSRETNRNLLQRLLKGGFRWNFKENFA